MKILKLRFLQSLVQHSLNGPRAFYSLSLMGLLLFSISSPLWAMPKQTIPIVPRVGIMSAIPHEFLATKKHLSELTEMKIGPYDVTLGYMGQYRVPVALILTGIGKVNVASAAQFLISELKVPALIFTGVAAGLNSSYKVGDIAISSGAFEHDFGSYSEAEEFIRHPAGYAPGAPQSDEFVDYHDLMQWPNWSTQFLLPNYAKELLTHTQWDLRFFVKGKGIVPRVHLGISAAGDQFVNSNRHIERIRNDGADFLEMESGAIAQVAQRNKVPFLNLRAISDKGGSGSMEEFYTFLEATSELSGRVLKVLFDDVLLGPYFARLKPHTREFRVITCQRVLSGQSPTGQESFILKEKGSR